jgi:hypothetical protein
MLHPLEQSGSILCLSQAMFKTGSSLQGRHNVFSVKWELIFKYRSMQFMLHGTTHSKQMLWKGKFSASRSLSVHLVGSPLL